ncbi:MULTISPECIES: polyphosphate kinase 2 family protein [Clostridium]|uniref:polyphosphate kinase 2 family protein n=1 Tax=Clostridium TaxID=1485 RepID=UPI0008250E2E|nr:MULTISPECIES: polyphosphate kinase 2 family protein [Clostridium]PJI08079.1 polyphosphate kinase 2 family protein [Clostridium sp. CT7]
MDISNFKISSKNDFKLKDIKTDYTYDITSKETAKALLEENIKTMARLQDKLYSQSHYGILIILQGMDTSGKDSAIKHVMSGVNPQGTGVFSFKEPSSEDLKHDYLRKAAVHLPERGQIQIFNRSYYEEVLVVRVHNLLKNENLPDDFITSDIWEKRYNHINNFEKYLFENAIIPIKLFLHISKDEQKKRLIARIDDKSKNWKFSGADIRERKYWDTYQKYYEETISRTSTEIAPWYVIPSDKKWFARLLISDIIVQTLENLKLEYPKLSDSEITNLDEYRKQL